MRSPRTDTGHRHSRPGMARKKPYFAFAALIIASASVIALVTVRPQGAAYTIEPVRPASAASSIESKDHQPAATAANRIPVHLDGAVAAPGVYYVPDNAILEEAVRAAGGLLPDADPSRVNLAMRIQANMKIHIPKTGETAAVFLPASGQDPESEPSSIDINRATLKELETLPGVGPSTADAIIRFRNQFGPFKTIEDLMRVPGIKEGRFARMKDRLCVGGSGN